jgi:hypothetical protein
LAKASSSTATSAGADTTHKVCHATGCRAVKLRLRAVFLQGMEHTPWVSMPWGRAIHAMTCHEHRPCRATYMPCRWASTTNSAR